MYAYLIYFVYSPLPTRRTWVHTCNGFGAVGRLESCRDGISVRVAYRIVVTELVVHHLDFVVVPYQAVGSFLVLFLALFRPPRRGYVAQLVVLFAGVVEVVRQLVPHETAYGPVIQRSAETHVRARDVNM